MRRPLTFISLLALMLSMLALPAAAHHRVGHDQGGGGNCDAAVGDITGVKFDLQDFTLVSGILSKTFPGIPSSTNTGGPDDVFYDVLAELKDADGNASLTSVTFTIFQAGTDDEVEGAQVVFCFKASNANSGPTTISSGGTYDVDFVNPGGNAPDLSNLVVYYVIPPAQVEATLSGAKYRDALPPDPASEGLDGWTIEVFSVVGTTFTKLVTDPDPIVTADGGLWSATVSVAPGTQLAICEVQQAGWTQLVPASGTGTIQKGGYTCYLRTVTTESDEFTNLDFVNSEETGQWCSPGYWRQAHHLGSWAATGISPDERYSTYFGNISLSKKAQREGATSDPTLWEVLQSPQWYGGEAFNNVGDLLSGAHPDVAFDGERVEDSCPLGRAPAGGTA
jgi:hypothetical protein